MEYISNGQSDGQCHCPHCWQHHLVANLFKKLFNFSLNILDLSTAFTGNLRGWGWGTLHSSYFQYIHDNHFTVSLHTCQSTISKSGRLTATFCL